jgi:TPP-dependent pyruvate/acetoin dehydrogenase alpha subunit
MSDPDLYRTKEEIEEWKKRDPIPLFESRLRDWGLLTEVDGARIEKEVATEIDEAVRFAEASPFEPVEELLKDVSGPVKC